MQAIIYGFSILAGIALLYFGAELLVRSAVSGAVRLSIPPLAVGLTVVAFGTSAPEIVVSMTSALKGFSSVAVGNAIGSNIINSALILGILSLFLPVFASRKIIRVDFPCMLAAYAAVVFVIMADLPFFEVSTINRLEGLILIILLIIYLISVYKLSTKNIETLDESANEVEEEVKSASKFTNLSWALLITLFITGIIMLAIGGDLLLRGATWYAAEIFGVSERIIAITVVAFATSFPELFTSLVAIMHKESDISLGNIIGSNIFNSLGVLGIAALVNPISGLAENFTFDIISMCFFGLFIWIILWLNKKLYRYSAFILLAFYAVYLFFILGV